MRFLKEDSKRYHKKMLMEKFNSYEKYIKNDKFIKVLDRFLHTKLIAMNYEERKEYIETWVLPKEQSEYIFLLIESIYLTKYMKHQLPLYTDERVASDIMLNIDNVCEEMWSDNDWDE